MSIGSAYLLKEGIDAPLPTKEKGLQTTIKRNFKEKDYAIFNTLFRRKTRTYLLILEKDSINAESHMQTSCCLEWMSEGICVTSSPHM